MLMGFLPGSTVLVDRRRTDAGSDAFPPARFHPCLRCLLPLLRLRQAIARRPGIHTRLANSLSAMIFLGWHSPRLRAMRRYSMAGLTFPAVRSPLPCSSSWRHGPIRMLDSQCVAWIFVEDLRIQLQRGLVLLPPLRYLCWPSRLVPRFLRIRADCGSTLSALRYIFSAM